MKDKVFIDTNILIYSIDNYDQGKQKKAREIIRKISLEELGVISTQVLQEFYVAATKKLHVQPLLIKEVMKGFSKFEIVQVSVEIINTAIEISQINQVSFWDALIIASAEASNCKILLTEDMNSDQIISDVQIINPFTI